MTRINEVVTTYDTVVKIVDADAKQSAKSEEGRAYGGVYEDKIQISKEYKEWLAF